MTKRDAFVILGSVVGIAIAIALFAFWPVDPPDPDSAAIAQIRKESRVTQVPLDPSLYQAGTAQFSFITNTEAQRVRWSGGSPKTPQIDVKDGAVFYLRSDALMPDGHCFASLHFEGVSNVLYVTLPTRTCKELGLVGSK